MPDILIMCPLTAELVQTGLDTETVILEILPPLEVPLHCSSLSPNTLLEASNRLGERAEFP
jgi:hypothetical protein